MPVVVGSILEGKVTGITNFGAFVELDGGETGLVHISEVADTYVKNVNDFLKMDQRVRVKVISVDANGKIGLSIKELEKAQHRSQQNRASFEDKLTKFLKDSEERQTDIKRKLDKRSKKKSF